MKICCHFEWKEEGTAQLTDDGRPLLPSLPRSVGIYRLTFEGRGKSAVYVGETEDLKRRAYHYRNPGPRQKTSLRINALLRQELSQGTQVTIATVTEPRIEIEGKEITVDLARRTHRLLFENAVLLAVAHEGVHEIHNL